MTFYVSNEIKSNRCGLNWDIMNIIFMDDIMDDIIWDTESSL